ncbi:MAG: acyl carrier protein [Butyrivibrio sp.]|nr:acyl carrier protein [Butyrivibrio sp.]
MEFEKMKEVIANVLNVDPEEIKLETTFTEDLGADSLDLFQIIMGLEDEFDVQIDPEKTENISTVGEAVELLKGALANK